MKPIHPLPDPKNQKAFDIVQYAIDKYKSDAPFVIGVTGAGGAGKTTFGNNIVAYYGVDNCLSIDLDDYLISRELRGKLGVTGYDPRANKLCEARKNIEELCARKPTSKPRYDHSTGNILSNETVSPKDLIIIEGVTTLYPELVELIDISFFLDALEETQIKSRIERDVNKRGYTHEEALTLFKSVQPDYARFIEPTKKSASVVFKVGTDYIMHPIHIDEMFGF
jgi:phosphoribulokinase